MNLEQARPFGLLAIAGLLLSALAWSRMTRRATGRDARLTWLYFYALLGAVVGAKLAFLVADGWHYRGDWLALLTGRSITGGLLGGYAGVELGKKWLGYGQPTGDLFAVVVPLGLALGRVGCLLQGCCPGVPCSAAWWTINDVHGVARWPAAAVELAFNAAFVAWAMLAARRGWQRGNRFHVYLIAYGIFRFAHEFLRDDVRWAGPFTGYHLWAAVLVVFGAVRYVQRRREPLAVSGSTGDGEGALGLTTPILAAARGDARPTVN